LAPDRLDLADRDAVRRLLADLGVRPSKRLGQNFLVDAEAVEGIGSIVADEEPTQVVEIGAGLGAVTRVLAPLAGRVTAIELDRRLVEALERAVEDLCNVDVVSKDALEFEFERGPDGDRALVVGSIPYAITAPLVQHIIAGRDALSGAVLVTQAEVAEKIAASPGPSGNALGVLVRAYADVCIVRRIGRGSFHPVPDVDSTLWTIHFLQRARFEAAPEAFFGVVRAIYGVRRKMLRVALRSLASRETIARALEVANVEGTVRGETLGFEELDRLGRALEAAGVSFGRDVSA